MLIIMICYCRLLEVNGKIVLTKSREDLTRLLSAAPDPAQIVVLRKKDDVQNDHPFESHPNKGEVAALRNELEVVRDQAEEAQKTKDGLRADNVRLTHRISYLEEQVSFSATSSKFIYHKLLLPILLNPQCLSGIRTPES